MEFLGNQKLSKRTIDEYTRYLSTINFDNLGTEYFNKWISKNNNNVARSFIKKFIEFLYDYKYNDFLNYRVPKIKGRREKKEKIVLHKDQIINLADSVKSKQLKLMILLSFYLGLRKTEMINLCLKDLDFDNQVVKIRSEFAKGKKFREIPMPEPVAELLIDYFNGFNNDIIMEAFKQNKKLFNRSLAWWYKHLTKETKKMFGISYYPHSLRRSCGTYLKSIGWDLQEIAEYLGHDDIKSTQIYAILAKDTIKNKVKDSF